MANRALTWAGHSPWSLGSSLGMKLPTHRWALTVSINIIMKGPKQKIQSNVVSMQLYFLLGFFSGIEFKYTRRRPDATEILVHKQEAIICSMVGCLPSPVESPDGVTGVIVCEGFMRFVCSTGQIG